MEKRKRKDIYINDSKAIKEAVERIATPIFDKVLQETKTNSMTTVTILWRPNNYRLTAPITKEFDRNSTLKKINSAIGSTIQRRNYSYSEHTKKISIKNYKGITIQIDRKSITGIYSNQIINQITAKNINLVNERIEQRKQEIEKQIKDTLNEFCKQFNMCINTQLAKWTRFEDWIKGEDFIDKIPKSKIWHDTYTKKVYEKGIEFIKPKGVEEQPTTYLKNYLKNRAIEDMTPEIVKELQAIRKDVNLGRLETTQDINKLSKEALQPLTAQIKLHLEVMRNINKGIKELNKPTLWQRILKKIGI